MSTTNADQIVRYKGFNVEIKNVSSGTSDVDNSWKSISGGALCTEMVEATVGGDGERRFTPGKQYVSDITMVGYMTGSRKALMEWLKASAAGDTAKLRASITITPLKVDGSPAPAHNYSDCMITRIQVPRLSAGSAEPIEEVVVCKATRYETA